MGAYRGSVHVEVVRVREWPRIFIPVLLVARYIAKHHGGDATIKALDLVVIL